MLYKGLIEQEPLPVIPIGCSDEKPGRIQDFILKGKAALVSVGIITDSVLGFLCMHGPNCKLGNFCTTGKRLQEVYVLGGLILPVWGSVSKALDKQVRWSHKRIRVVNIETTSDSQRIVGLLIPNAAVESVLQDLAWVQDIEDD